MVSDERVLYFNNHDGVKSFDLETGIAETVFESPDVAFILPINETLLNWGDSAGTMYIYDAELGESRVTDQWEVNRLLSERYQSKVAE